MGIAIDREPPDFMTDPKQRAAFRSLTTVAEQNAFISNPNTTKYFGEPTITAPLLAGVPISDTKGIGKFMTDQLGQSIAPPITGISDKIRKAMAESPLLTAGAGVLAGAALTAGAMSLLKGKKAKKRKTTAKRVKYLKRRKTKKTRPSKRKKHSTRKPRHGTKKWMAYIRGKRGKGKRKKKAKRRR